MDRGAWRATIHTITESNTTEVNHDLAHGYTGYIIKDKFTDFLLLLSF